MLASNEIIINIKSPGCSTVGQRAIYPPSNITFISYHNIPFFVVGSFFSPGAAQRVISYPHLLLVLQSRLTQMCNTKLLSLFWIWYQELSVLCRFGRWGKIFKCNREMLRVYEILKPFFKFKIVLNFFSNLDNLSLRTII